MLSKLIWVDIWIGFGRAAVYIFNVLVFEVMFDNFWGIAFMLGHLTYAEIVF
jgi:hypothetical protein